jgi:hypothetical protein
MTKFYTTFKLKNHFFFLNTFDPFLNAIQKCVNFLKHILLKFLMIFEKKYLNF